MLREARKNLAGATPALRKGVCLSQLKGIGDIGGDTLATEFFGWREFKNRGEVGALAGLTGTPFQSMRVYAPGWQRKFYIRATQLPFGVGCVHAQAIRKIKQNRAVKVGTKLFGLE